VYTFVKPAYCLNPRGRVKHILLHASCAHFLIATPTKLPQPICNSPFACIVMQLSHGVHTNNTYFHLLEGASYRSMCVPQHVVLCENQHLALGKSEEGRTIRLDMGKKTLRLIGTLLVHASMPTNEWPEQTFKLSWKNECAV